MINLQVIAIDQRYVIGSPGRTENHLVIALPNGKEVRAVVDAETVAQLIELDVQTLGHQPPPAHAPAPPQHQVEASPWDAVLADGPAAAASEVQRVAEELGTVEWLALEDGVLSAPMKAAFAAVGAPPRLSPAAIRALEADINERFDETMWGEILGTAPQQPQDAFASVQIDAPTPAAPAPPVAPATAPAPGPVPAPHPVLGQIQWAEGQVMLPSQARRARTVPKDDFGYPVLNDGSVDPGEIVGGGDDVDEDGVGSL